MGLPLPPGTYNQLAGVSRPDQDAQDWDMLAHDPHLLMAQAWRAYKGQFRRPFKRMDPSAPDFNVIVNRCEPIVSAACEFLYGDELEIEVPDSEAAEQYLDKVLHAQPLGKMPTLYEAEINFAVFGHGFIKLVPDDDDTAPFPALHVLDPQCMEMETDPFNVNRKTRYVFHYPTEDDRAGGGETIERRQVIERNAGAGATNEGGAGDGGWTIHDQERRSAGSMLNDVSTQDPEANWVDVQVTPWNYAWAPIHEGKNLPEACSAWGKPDLRADIIHLNDVLIRTESNLAKIIHYHGHPKDIFFGVSGWREIDVSPSDALTVPNPNAKAQRLEMNGDLVAISNHLDSLRESMDELSHYPAVALGRIRNLPGVPSGVALKVAMRPALAQTKLKRQLRESVLRKLCQHILELGGYGAELDIVFHWAEILPSDDLVEAQSAQIWKTIGASTRTLLERGGFTWDVEQDHNMEEQQDQMDAMMRGQMAPGMPPPDDTAMDGGSGDGADSGADASGQPAEGTGQPSASAPPQPPVNHPAAQRQRAMMRATATAAKGVGR